MYVIEVHSSENYAMIRSTDHHRTPVNFAESELFRGNRVKNLRNKFEKEKTLDGGSGKKISCFSTPPRSHLTSYSSEGQNGFAKMGRFEGKVAIVTGSSNGIGRGIAALFAKEGAKVIVTGRDEVGLKDTVADCITSGATDNDVLCVRGDITQEQFRKKLVEDTLQKFGKIDILVNNAGAIDKDNSGMLPSFSEQDMTNYDYVMSINLRSIVHMLQLCLPHLVESKGEVVNMGSVASLPVAVPTLPFYATSKAALAQLTRSIAFEYITKGVRINCVCPGMIATKILQKQGLPDETSRKMESNLAANPLLIPAQYVGEPEDIANAVAFLCDRSASRYIVGHSLVVDGGSHIVMPLISGKFTDYM